MARVKGSVFGPRFNYIRNNGGEAKEQEVFAQLSEELQKEFKRQIIVSQWYPFEYYTDLNRAIVKVLGKGDVSILQSVGRFSADDALHGIYKMFFKVGSPDVIVQMAILVWKRYFQNGDIAVERVAPRELNVHCTNIEVFAAEHFYSVLGWMQRVLELSGAKSVTAKLTKLEKSEVIIYLAWV